MARPDDYLVVFGRVRGTVTLLIAQRDFHRAPFIGYLKTYI
jgi:hypothetical protein